MSKGRPWLGAALQTAQDLVAVRRVYGEPVVREGVTVIPAAAVSGAFGAGTGTDRNGQQGEGGGARLHGRPVGALVITGDRVEWRPAVDVTRLAGLAGLVTVVYLVTRRGRASG